MYRVRLFRAFLLLLSIVYLLVLVKYLIFDRTVYTNFGVRHANFKPFHSIGQYIALWDHYNFNTWAMNLFGNLVMLFPFGVLLPLLLPPMKKLIQFVLTLLIFNLSIEVLQYITMFGSFDIDDIILNSTGAMVGYSCSRLFLFIPFTRSFFPPSASKGRAAEIKM